MQHRNPTYYASHPDLVPDRYMKQFTRDHLPPTCTVTDLDLVILSPGGCLRFIEYKARSARAKWAQQFMYNMISNVLFVGLSVKAFFNKFRKGTFHIRKVYKPLFITFQNLNFDDGRAWINGCEVTKHEAIRLFRFGEDCCNCFPKQCNVCS